MENDNEKVATDEDNNSAHSSVQEEHLGFGNEPTIGQLQTRLQSSEATNEKLQRENYYLKKLLSLQFDSDLKARKSSKQLACAAEGNSGVVSPFQDKQFIKVFPDVVLSRIFGNIEDQETLLGCRLVCPQWNHTIITIITTAEFMGRIDFPVWHPRLFLDLQIANQVKSIVFNYCFAANSDYMTEFLDLISKTVRKVTFDYELDENSALNQKLNFFSILEKCEEIQELIITGSNKELIKACYKNTRIAAANTIQILSIKPSGLETVEDCAGISEILYKLQNLASLEIITPNIMVVNVQILKVVYEYMVKYPQVLKEIRITGLPNVGSRDLSFHTYLLQIALLIGKNGTTRFCPRPFIDMNVLLKLEEKADFEPRCFDKYSVGILNFSGNHLENLKRLETCTKLNMLHLVFERNLMEGEVSFIKLLPNLSHLKLTCIGDYRLNWESITRLDEAFNSGLEDVKQLDIVKDIFDSLRVFLWPRYFPSLQVLKLRFMKITPTDIFVVLSTLDKLKHLILEDLTELNDEAFTRTVRKKEDASEMPSIATFNMLTKLTIKNCPQLTNRCIDNGISKVITLVELYIEGTTNTTEDICTGHHFKVIRKN